MRYLAFAHVMLVSVFEGAGMVFALEMARQLALQALNKGGAYVLCFLPATYLVVLAISIVIDVLQDVYLGLQVVSEPDDDLDDLGP